MVLIDTSVWIEFLRKSGSPAAKSRVEQLIVERRAAYTCPIRFELLAGARDQEVPVVQEAMTYANRYYFEAVHWESAATIYRGLRKLGITVPRDDVCIAAAASAMKLPIVCRDKHFDLINLKAKLGLEVEQL